MLVSKATQSNPSNALTLSATVMYCGVELDRCSLTATDRLSKTVAGQAPIVSADCTHGL